MNGRSINRKALVNNLVKLRIILRKTIIIACVLLSTQIATALDFKTSAWNNLQVKVDEKELILSIYIFPDNKIKGNYFNKADHLQISVWGDLTNGQITLKDGVNNIFSFPVRNSKSAAVYQRSSKLQGYFFNKKLDQKTDKTYLFYQSSVGSYSHRYADLFFDDLAIEAFAAQVKTAILTGNKEWLSNSCFFNLLAETAPGEFTTIRSKEQFLKDYDRIISPAVVADVRQSHTKNMNYGYNRNVELGIPGMLPNITIDEFTDPKTNNSRLIITGISFNH